MKKKWVHVLFLAVCGAVLAVLLMAPEITTPRLPGDPVHADRKDYPSCPACHGPDSEAPMPADHTGENEHLRADHAKCYFCHKPQES